MIRLPIDGLLPELISHLESNTSAILHASPGSGKTTRVPPALLRTRFAGPAREIWVLEPRRLAAKYAAHRVAQEMGESVGRSVGYHFRFEKVAGPATRLHFLTEGMLIRKLISNPRLDQVAAVVLDEFHERHLHGDIALAYLARLQATLRPDLRLIVMSATLDAEAVASFLGNCRVFKVDSPVHPITLQHLPGPLAKPLDLTIRDTVLRALREPDAQGNPDRGDILVFLPGMADIRRAQERLQEQFAMDSAQGPLILALHGDLTREEQDRAVNKAERRKIILSTNVAETSLTIEGLTTVIDSGLHRVASFSWWSGVPSLRTRPISRASAIQRAGRAGRTSPGRCYRLYTQGEFSSRPAFEIPEIQRADLCQTVLELKSLGIDDLEAFPWFEAPSPRSLQSAQELLYRLGAIDRAAGPSGLTSLGERMVQAPAHPRISRMMLEAERRGVLDQAATLAAMISEGELDRSNGQSISDPLDLLTSAERDPFLRRARTHLLGAFGNRDFSRNSARRTEKQLNDLRFALLSGFPDRVARKRKLGASVARATGRDGAQLTELIFSSGGSATVNEAGVITESDTFVILDIQEQQAQGQARSQLKVRAVSPIQPEWLFDLEPSMIDEKDEVTWDSERERVRAVSRMSYGELVLIEEDRAVPDGAQAAQVLLRAALGVDALRAHELQAADWVRALSKIADPELIENTIARFSLIAEHEPHLLPETAHAPNQGGWQTLLAQAVLSLLDGKLRLAELRDMDWQTSLLYAMFPQNAAKIESLLPTHISLTPRRRAPIHYKLGQPPWLESRLQDFFGLKRGPSILNGKMPLTLHLLAPNQRAVQVTTDLPGFWVRTYPELRTALSRRYPRHSWPEDPLQLIPTED